MVRYNKKNTPKYDDGSMDIIEQLALLVALLGQVFIIYLFFDMYEYIWWLGLGLSISITTAFYFFIKYMVDYFHKMYY